MDVRELTERARAGDQEAFRDLTEPYRPELLLHCYRILGSIQDAEDALQEAMLAAWRGLPGFGGRSAVRTWLYRIATTRCLNVLRSHRRRGPADTSLLPPNLPAPSRSGEVLWLEPYPDALLEGIPDAAPGPDATLETREAVSLAFITAMQLLPPRQRAVQILRDVLGFHTNEVAEMLGTTEDSVNNALKRARAAVGSRLPARATQSDVPLPRSDAERRLVERFTVLFESGDVAGIVALLAHDVVFAMPPAPYEWRGREAARQFFGEVWQGTGRRLIATRANGQPAFGLYAPVPGNQTTREGRALLVLTLRVEGVSAITAFGAGLLSRFGLPEAISVAS
jgi:RNA polymerase sigma-70 factor (ECF subfamily)